MKRFALALLLSGVAFAQAPSTPSGNLTIRFLDVGQGDAVLVTSPEGQSLVYDGGRSESRMRELIRQYDIKNVALVVASHADADHITGLIPVVALNKPKYFVNNGLAGTTATWSRLVNVVSQVGTQGLKASGQVFNLGSVKVTVLAPPPGMDDQNTNSVGLKIEYGTFTALMTGDSETPETSAWLKAYGQTLGPVSVYKSIHHGAANGDNRTWLAAVRPQNVVVSVGPNNYGHPTKSALDLYRSVGATTYRTDLNGTVTVTVQPGGAYRITTERGTGVAGTPVKTPVPARGVPTTPAAPAPVRTAPVVAPAAPAGSVYYANCAAVKAAGKSPLLRGQPGYRAGLDRDGDGRACE